MNEEKMKKYGQEAAVFMVKNLREKGMADSEIKNFLANPKNKQKSLKLFHESRMKELDQIETELNALFIPNS